ncbi:MAG: hypothetical protein D3904_06075 [Candidatus Electrothrix sp. EH2]|nr:hypothetical protein [Candidatus Electrothrix sp. EH2]
MLVAAPAVTSAKNKIRVCHEGKTLLIDVADAGKHRRQGDTPGPCPSDAQVKPKEPKEEPVEPVHVIQEPTRNPDPDRKQYRTFRPDPGFQPGTEDRSFDNSLIEMNKKAGSRLDQYIIDLSSAFNIPRQNIINLLNQEKIQPADIFMLLQTAKLSGQPYQELVPQFKQHRSQGWGTVMQSLGVQPGSGNFFQLKQNIPRAMQNYTTWEEESLSQGHEQHPQTRQHGKFLLKRDFRPHTGDSEFDALLIELNRSGGGNIDQYLADLSYAFNIPGKKVDALLYRQGIQPADIFMILQTARLSGQPYRKLVRKFKNHKSKGWAGVVMSLGIKPRSRMFLLLKEDIPPSIRQYVTAWDDDPRWEKGSKKGKGPKKKKGSKRRKGSKERKPKMW